MLLLLLLLVVTGLRGTFVVSPLSSPVVVVLCGNGPELAALASSRSTTLNATVLVAAVAAASASSPAVLSERETEI